MLRPNDLINWVKSSILLHTKNALVHIYILFQNKKPSLRSQRHKPVNLNCKLIWFSHFSPLFSRGLFRQMSQSCCPVVTTEACHLNSQYYGRIVGCSERWIKTETKHFSGGYWHFEPRRQRQMDLVSSSFKMLVSHLRKGRFLLFKQKGLVSALNNTLPEYLYSSCVPHMFSIIKPKTASMNYPHL